MFKQKISQVNNFLNPVLRCFLMITRNFLKQILSTALTVKGHEVFLSM